LRLGIVVTASCVVIACAPAPDRSQLTVEYYRIHAPERERTLAECEQDPGSLGQQPECINAREAARQLGIGSLKSLPPMGLPATPNSPSGS